MSQATQEKLTGTNYQNLKESTTYYFEIPSAYQLPHAIKESLSKNGSHLILAKGSYPIQITEEAFTITFTLE